MPPAGRLFFVALEGALERRLEDKAAQLPPVDSMRLRKSAEASLAAGKRYQKSHKKKPVCHFFGRGTCKNGDQCTFVHEAREAFAAPRASDQQEPQRRGDASTDYGVVDQIEGQEQLASKAVCDRSPRTPGLMPIPIPVPVEKKKPASS